MPNGDTGPSAQRTAWWRGPWSSDGKRCYGPSDRSATTMTDSSANSRLSSLARNELESQALSSDLPALWHAPETTHKDRKEIVRHLVEKVVVHVKNDSEYVDVTIHWRGGFVSQHEVVRPVKSYEKLRDFDKLMDRIVTLRHEGRTAAQIADCLNQEGFSPPKRCGKFFPELVRQLLKRRGLANETTYIDQPGPHEWWLSKLAGKIPVSAGKLADWARRGWVHSRKTHAQGLWVLWADAQELKRLRGLATRSHRGTVEYPTKLTTPKERPSQ